jgi:hypothetical protein
VEVGNLLAGFGLPASALELEITETTLMVDPGRSGEVLGPCERSACPSPWMIAALATRRWPTCNSSPSTS